MNKRATFSIISLGCPKNTVDSEILKGGLVNSDFIYTDNLEEAKVIIINTCGFIETAREESIDTILDAIMLKKRGNVKKVFVMGCMSQRYSEELKREFPEVDGIYGVESQSAIVKELLGKSNKFCDVERIRSMITPEHYAYLKIAEGCDNACSFCSIPLMRGKQKSRTIKSIIEESIYLHNKGVKELILIAQDLTRYGTDLPTKITLVDVLEELLSLNLFHWVRIMYSNPDFWMSKLNDLFCKYPNLCPYIDIPVQHASDKILKLMNRGKNCNEIRKILKSIRSDVQNVALRTSVMVGFPSETEDDFNELLDFVEEVKFERLGVFIYSEEEGTSAEKLENNVPEEEKEQRKDIVMAIQYDISGEFAMSKIGEQIEVLIERKDNFGYIGRTVWDAPEIDCFVRVRSEKDIEIGEFYKVKIDSVEGLDLVGKVR
ncbi:MAG: 30S ribosomal protein S12 methylthiotransferase RimO [Candidatus Neomarinimicrobiota bacterium]|nr:MAG: 30S ribosomal protein S12 methylthiotransferase RimO [Candidatus Neomarinimicrobiota bacterium]